MKELAEFTFHSRHLLPVKVAKNGEKAIEEWIINQQQSHRFSEGDDVVHRDNIELTLHVKEILKEKRQIKNGYGPDGKPCFKTVSRMIGIRCYYWKNAESED